MSTPRMQAAKNGAIHYLGSACKRCGSSVRYVTTGVCVDCTKANNNSVRAKIAQLRKEAKEGA